MDRLEHVEGQAEVEGTSVIDNGQETYIQQYQDAVENDGGASQSMQTVQLQQAEDGSISYTVETAGGDDGEEEQVILQIHHIAPDGEEEQAEEEEEEEEEDTQNYVIDVSSLLEAGAGHGQIVQMANGQLVQLVRTEDGVQALELEETSEGLQVVQQGEDLRISHIEDSEEASQEMHVVAEDEDGTRVVYRVQEDTDDGITDVSQEYATADGEEQAESTMVADSTPAALTASATVSTPDTVSTLGTVSIPGTIYTPGTISTPGTVSTLATVSTPQTVYSSTAAQVTAVTMVTDLPIERSAVGLVENQVGMVRDSLVTQDTRGTAVVTSVPVAKPITTEGIQATQIQELEINVPTASNASSSAAVSTPLNRSISKSSETGSDSVARNSQGVTLVTGPTGQQVIVTKRVISPSSVTQVIVSDKTAPENEVHVTPTVIEPAVHTGLPPQVQMTAAAAAPAMPQPEVQVPTHCEAITATIPVSQVVEDCQGTGTITHDSENQYDVIHVHDAEHTETASHEVGDVCEYVCPQCGEKTPDRTKFLDHLKTHSNSKAKVPLEYCDICGASVTNKRMLQAHMDRYHKNTDPSVGTGTEKGMFLCSICHVRCATLQDRNSHVQEKHFPCKVCGAVLSTLASLNKHHTQTHQCPCGHVAMTRAQLVTHCEQVHNKAKAQPANDPVTAAVKTKPAILLQKRKVVESNQEVELFTDMNLPAKKIKNSSTPGGIIIKREIESPTMVETDSTEQSLRGKYQCSVCGGRYQDSVLLRQHFSHVHCCSDCGKVCANLRELRSHKAMQHKKDKAPKGVSDKPHKCKKCPAAFADIKNLERHQNSHLDNKVYEHMCHICGRGFEGYMVARYKHHLESHFK